MKQTMCLFSFLCASLTAGTIHFSPQEPMKLEGLRPESFQGKLLKDSDRLAVDPKKQSAENYVLLDSRDFGGGAPFKEFTLTLISHLNQPEKRISAFGSADGKTFTRLPDGTVKNTSSLPGGYGSTQILYDNRTSYRYLKLSLRVEPADYWRCQLARLDYPEPETKAASVCNRVLKFDFASTTACKLENLKRENWKSNLYGVGTRLTLAKKEQGSVTIDMANSNAAIFDSLELQLLSHSSLKGPLTARFTAEGSGDGFRFQPIRLEQKGKAKSFAGGYQLTAFASRQTGPFRFLKLTIKNLAPNNYWQFQIAGLSLKTDGKEPAPVRETAPGKTLTAPENVSGAVITLKIPAGAGKNTRIAFRADGVPLSFRALDEENQRKSFTRTIELISGKPFQTLEVSARTKAGKELEITGCEWIRDRKSDLRRRFGEVPVYTLKGNSVKADTLHASLAYSDGELAEQDLSAIRWNRITLNDNGYIGHNWVGGFYRRPDTRIVGGIYRFKLKAAPANDQEVFLHIPQSAFITDLFVDGRKAAHFTEGFLPLSANLTPFLKPDREADIVIRVAGYRHAIKQDGTVLYPVGAMGLWTGGIPMPPEIRLHNKLRTEKLFVSSSDNQLKLEADLLNRTDQKFNGTAEFVITGPDGTELLRKQLPATLAGGEKRKISAEIPVDGKLRRWDIGKPNLYLARIDLKSADFTHKGEPVRFGYRTLELRKDSMYLNGRKIRLFGPWAHIGEWTYKVYYHGRKLSHKEVYETLLKHGMNAGRLHCQPYDKAFYDAADEAGFLLIAESALAHRPANEAALEHIRSFVTEYRNHPSITIWSGSNEFEHWISPRRVKTMQFLVRVQDEIKKLDPTRPVQHSGFGDALGKLDIYNIHYPADTTSFPQSLYWTRNPEAYVAGNYKDNFQRYNPIGKKPLAYGEERIPGRSSTAFLFGEPALRAYYASANPGDRKALDKVYEMLARDWALRTRAEREQNVLLICPNVFYPRLDSVFVAELAKEFRPAGAYPKFMNPVWTAGSTRTVPFVFFEDSGFGSSGKVSISLRYDGRETLLAELPHKLNGGELKEIPVTVKVPDAGTKAQLATVYKDGSGKEIYRDETPVKLEKPYHPAPLNETLYVWGNSPELRRFAEKHGIRQTSLSPADQIPRECRVLAITPELPETELLKQTEKLARFTAAGGRVILLERMVRRSCLPSDAVFSDASRVEACIGFPAYGGHPILDGITEEDLRYWDPENYNISKTHSQKPEHGNFVPLVDGERNLSGVHLWLLYHGRGFYLVNHLNLLKHAANVPQAERLLRQAVEYAFRAKPREWRRADVLAGKNDFSATCLKKDIQLDGQAEKAETLLVTGEALQTHDLNSILDKAKKYKNVLIFNIPQNKVAELAGDLTGSAPGTEKQTDAAKPSYYFKEYGPLYTGLTSADLDWNVSQNVPYRFKASGKWRSFISGGADAVWNGDGGRTVALINLPLDRDVPESGRKSRFYSQILTNLGVKLKSAPVRNYDPAAAKYRTVDIAPVCNTSRERLFGKTLSGGRVTLEGIPWQLPRESAANQNSMLRLNGHAKLPRSGVIYDTPFDSFDLETPEKIELKLPVDQAESLFFLHTTNRNWKLHPDSSVVAEYRINFTDGTSISLPLKMGEHIADGRTTHKGIRRAKTIAVLPIEVNPSGEKAGLFLYEWNNPTPEKKIRNIEIVNRFNPPHDLMLLGITMQETNKKFK